MLDTLPGLGKMVLGILVRGESKRGKICTQYTFSQTDLAWGKVIIVAVIPEVPENFPFQPCGGQDGLGSFFTVEYLCVE